MINAMSLVRWHLLTIPRISQHGHQL